MATKKELDEATSAATATTDTAAREYAERINIEREQRMIEHEQQLVGVEIIVKSPASLSRAMQ